MLALKPDRVRIELGGFEYSASKVLIGLDGGTLSGDRAYRAIIHPALTEGEGTPKINAHSADMDAPSLNGGTGSEPGEAKNAG
jgi:stage II sporulation protein GA (sporulation sigma-E factor processing peptidase)